MENMARRRRTSKKRKSGDLRDKRRKAVRRSSSRRAPSPSTVRRVLVIIVLLVILVTALLIYERGKEPAEDDNDPDGNGPPVVNEPPVPKASVTPSEVFTGENVTFDGSRSYDKDGRIINYTWEVHQDWLTGQVIDTYYGRKFNRTYDEPGAKYIVLFVTDDDSDRNSTVSENKYGGSTIVIHNRDPVAKAGENLTTTVGSEIYLDGGESYDEDGEIIEYEWDFGDGNTSSGVFVSHAYLQPGTYTVTLTVRDDHKASTSDTLKVVVT